MRKIILAVLIFYFGMCFIPTGYYVVAEEQKPILAIVIDDFGGCVRRGVEEMLSLEIPLTCAIMPKLEYSTEDAESAFKNGHEVILHMPMEAHTCLPENWYGNVFVRNSDTPEHASALVKECYESIPHAVGMNIHIGSGVCQHKDLMTAIITQAKDENAYFLDSVTTPKTICENVAKEVSAPFAKRYEFLEKTGVHSYSYACGIIKSACAEAKKHGHAVIIGHVGMEGGITTYQAIRDNIDYIKDQGIELVTVSQLINKINNI